MEAHFNKATDFLAYGPIPGQLYERLRSDYPQALDLDAANLPLPLEPPAPLVRHRFTSATGGRLFQVGNGIVSVNSLAYETYAVFRDQVAQVVSKAVDLMGQPTKGVMRYINKIPTDGRRLEDVLLLGVRIPASRGDRWAAQQASCWRAIPGLGELQVAMAVPTDGRGDLILFDLQLRSEPFTESDPGALTSWMEAAHNELEEEFFSDLDPTFLESIR